MAVGDGKRGSVTLSSDIHNMMKLSHSVISMYYFCCNGAKES